MSAILSAETLNDFIGPSISCIKPVESLPPPPPSELTVGIEDADTPPSAQTAAQISLTDCLACSGCVTSSEAVLVAMQSHTEVLTALSQFPTKTFVALVSPQSRAALAVALHVSEREAGNVVARVLQSVGFAHVVDTNAFRQLALHYAAEEVVGAMANPDRKKPLLTSACPGFICYLESTHPALIPHLSALKSPQALGGTFVKALLGGGGDVYTVAIMPCYDKKLEGARVELTSSAWRPGEEDERDIDCVLTTREFFSLALARDIDPSTLPHTPPYFPPLTDSPTIQRFLTAAAPPVAPEDGTSGGHLAAVLSRLRALHPDATLQMKRGRNADTTDYVLTIDPTRQVKLSRCYGFRNIQNLVRRLKPPVPRRALPSFGGKGAGVAAVAERGGGRAAKKQAEELPLYVEVMACPGGCTNGGGQVKYEEAGQREVLRRVDEAYYSGGEEAAAAAAAAVGGGGQEERRDGKVGGELVGIEEVVDEWCRITGVKLDKLVRTTYRRVENDLGNRLGEKEVLELAGRDGGGW